MAVSDSFVAFVLEQFECAGATGDITSKRMFSGVGLWTDDLFFALLSRDVLYLKTDESNRATFEAAGARPFDPHPGQHRGKMPYYSVPVAVLEDADELGRWTAKAIAVARAKKSAKRTRSKPRRTTR